MLKKINRGLQRDDFKEILAEGKIIQTPLFGIRFKSPPNPLFEERGGTSCKFGWIISKKISAKAVDRNKIKRRLAEVIGKQIKNKKLIINNYKIIFLVKKLILGATIEEIETQVKYVFEKICSANSSSL